jgi:hypothetical protein
MSIISSPSRFAGAITGTAAIGVGIGIIGITATGVGGIVIGAIATGTIATGGNASRAGNAVSRYRPTMLVA